MNIKQYKDMYINSMNEVNDYLIDYNGGRFDKEFYSEWNYQIIEIWEEINERKDFYQFDSLLNFLIEEMATLTEECLYIDDGIGNAVANLVCLRYIEHGSYIEFDSFEERFIDMTEEKSPSELLNRLKDLSAKNYRSTF